MDIEDLIAARLYYQEGLLYVPTVYADCGASWMVIIILVIVLAAMVCLLICRGV